MQQSMRSTTAMAETSLYVHGRHRQQRGMISPERLRTTRKIHHPLASTSACIDLTEYEDVNDERETNFISSFSDPKLDHRVSSNYENVAADAVKNIKTLLDLGDIDDMTTRSTIRFSPKTSVTEEIILNAAHERYDGPIHVWTPSDEPPRPERVQRKEPKSEYHMAKQRLILSRRGRASNYNATKTTISTTNTAFNRSDVIASRNSTTDIVDLTRKHEELMQKSTDFRNYGNTSALLDIIHVDNENTNTEFSPPSSPKSTTSSSSNRLLIATGGMEKTIDNAPSGNNDLVSAFGYEFRKREGDETSDIIVIDDIMFPTAVTTTCNEKSEGNNRKVVTDPSSLASKNVAARFEAIRNSVANRLLALERSEAHPQLPLPDSMLESNEPDLTPPELQVVTDQINSLNEQQKTLEETMEPPSRTEEVQINETSQYEDHDSSVVTPTEAVTSSPSRASVIEGLIPPTVSSENKSDEADDSSIVPLRAEAEYRKKIQSNLAAISGLRSSVPVDEDKIESDFIAITKNLTPKQAPIEEYQNVTSNAGNSTPKIASRSRSGSIAQQWSNTEIPLGSDKEELIAQDPSLDPIFESVSEVAGDAISKKEIVKKGPPVILTANELCVGFCAANTEDTISVVPDPRNETTFSSTRTPLVPRMTSRCDINEKLSSNDETHLDSLVVDEKSKISDVNDTFEKEQASYPLSKDRTQFKTGNDLAISDDDTSMSYPSDVDFDDGKIESLTANPIDKRQLSVRSHSMDSKSQWSKSTIAATTISNNKKENDISGSENASFISENSGTRDSDNSDSDLDDDTGFYDTCFARQILDDACGWLDHDETSFCFKPSLLKKVKRRTAVGQTKKFYGRSPLLLRVPRNQILTRNYLKSRRKPNEPLMHFRPKKVKNQGNDIVQEFSSTPLRTRQNQKIFGSSPADETKVADESVSQSINADENKAAPFRQLENRVVDSKTIPTCESNSKEIVVKSKEMQSKLLSFKETESGIFEVDSKNSAIFEVKSAEEYTSPYFSTYQQMLRSRSMSPITSKPIERNKLKAQVSNRLKGLNDTGNNLDRRFEQSISESFDDVGNARSSDMERSTKRSVTADSIPEKLAPIDCAYDTSDSLNASIPFIASPKGQAEKVATEVEYLSRPVSRREGLAKLRYHKPIRQELIQLEHVNSDREAMLNNTMMNEAERLASLDSAEKLRRRAATLRRRRKVRERRNGSKQVALTQYSVKNGSGD